MPADALREILDPKRNGDLPVTATLTSRDRILAALRGTPTDHVPLTTWCFGLPAPPSLEWEQDGGPRRHWYSLRMEHLHTLPQPWTLEDDCQRALAWQTLGVDDVLDVSVPWSTHPEVTWSDTLHPAGTLDPRYPVVERTYRTPAGSLRHAVKLTGEDLGEGWVIQPPDRLPLIEDYNIPRAIEHVVAGPDDVGKLAYLYASPDAKARDWLRARIAAVGSFAFRHGLAVQAWAGFGMDALVWFAGTEGAIWLALDAPAAFAQLMETITRTDLARTELAAAEPAVDIVVARGWYSSTDFWSPDLFDRFVYPYVETLAATAHRHGKVFGYVMTTGVETLGPRLADAGVDVLYFVDPLDKQTTLKGLRDVLADRMTLVGGVNATRLMGTATQIRDDVRRALDLFGPTNRFILHPMDAVFPDTPWAGLEALLEAWEEGR